MFKRIAILAAGLLVPAGIALGVGAPSALAAGPNQHTVNVTVGQEIVISGLQDVVFNNVPGTLAIGCPVTDLTCATDNGDQTEKYTVTNNDAKGYTLTETAASGQFTSTTTSTLIPDTDWSISASNGGAPFTFSPSNSSTTVFTTNNVSAANGDTYTEDWTLNIPANTPQATYTNQLTYIATGN